jgi:hypothetical protein
MRNVLSLISVATFVITATGCASIITDDTAYINLQTSNGEAIQVTIDGQVFQAPGSVLVQKTGTDKIIISRNENCASQTVVPKQIEPAFFGNILLGGFLGSSTDYANNSMWTYTNNTIINCAFN